MRALLLATLVVLLSGCGGQHPFLMVQLCLNGEKDTEQFIGLMKSISQAHQMRYFDRSAISQKELADLKAGPDYDLINIGASDDDGVGWGGSNYGLSAYEIGIGFSGGSNPVEARKFADQVVALLNKRWPVHEVPPNQGATSVCK